jgi:hypothetical protein
MLGAARNAASGAKCLVFDEHFERQFENDYATANERDGLAKKVGLLARAGRDQFLLGEPDKAVNAATGTCSVARLAFANG